MRRIGSVFMIVMACGVMAVLYWLTPYMMHSPARWVNFLQILGAGAAVATGVVMLGAGVAMRSPQLTAPPARRVQPAPSVPTPQQVGQTLTLIETKVALALGDTSQRVTLDQAHRRIDHLGEALQVMVVMARKNSGL